MHIYNTRAYTQRNKPNKLHIHIQAVLGLGVLGVPWFRGFRAVSVWVQDFRGGRNRVLLVILWFRFQCFWVFCEGSSSEFRVWAVFWGQGFGIHGAANLISKLMEVKAQHFRFEGLGRQKGLGFDCLAFRVWVQVQHLRVCRCECQFQGGVGRDIEVWVVVIPPIVSIFLYYSRRPRLNFSSSDSGGPFLDQYRKPYSLGLLLKNFGMKHLKALAQLLRPRCQPRQHVRTQPLGHAFLGRKPSMF